MLLNHAIEQAGTGLNNTGTEIKQEQAYVNIIMD